MAKINFNLSSIQPATPRSSEPLPAGLYQVEITNSELKELKSGNGQGLSLEFTVIDPQEHAGRKVWTNLNVQHSNPTAQEIGLGQLSALWKACSTEELEDTDQLFGQIVRIKTKVREAQNGYGPRAEVIGYEPISAMKPAVSKPAAPAASKKPWQK